MSWIETVLSAAVESILSIVFVQLLYTGLQYTVESRSSASHGTGQNYTVYRGFHYYQLINNYKNTSWVIAVKGPSLPVPDPA